MAKSAVLDVKVLVDAAKAASELDQVGDKAEGLGSKLKGIGGAVAAAGIVAFASKAVSAASDLEQAVGGTEAVFESSAQTIHEWAADTEDAIRLSKTEFERLATSIGGTLKNAGVPLDQLASKTKDTMQLGADMAARWGTSTEEAVSAIGAALSRGEFDPLEKYNVSLSAAAVETEKLKLKTGDMKGASDAMLTAQARLNLIMDQSSAAIGAAASESETFAAAQENLSVAFDNFLAAVGAPLLSALGGIFNSLADIFPLVEPLAVAVSGLVGWVLDLPEPLLLAAGALAAWQVVGGLAGITTAFATAIKGLTVALKGLQASTIVGAALLAVMSAIAFFEDAMSDTEDQIADTNATYEKWLSTLQNGQVTENTRDTIALDGATSGLFDTYEKLGISTQAYVDASTGVEGGQEALRLSAQKATNALFQQDGVFGDIAYSAAQAGISQDQMIEAARSGDWSGITGKMQTYADEQSRLTGNTETGRVMMDSFFAALAAGKDPATAVAGATELAAQTAEKFGVSAADAEQAARALGDGEEDAAAKAQRLADDLDAAQKAAQATPVNTMMAQAKSEADIAARAVEALRIQIERLDGRLSNESAVAAWKRGISDGTAAMAQLREEGGLNVEAMKAWDVAALQNGAANQKFYDTMSQQVALYPDLIGQTFSAAYASSTAGTEQERLAEATNAAMTEAKFARDEIIGMGVAAGLSAEEAAALATKLGVLDTTQISPKLFEVIAHDADAQARILAIQQQQIGAKNFEITAGADGAIGTVDDVITYTDAAGNAMPPIPLHADPASAEGTVDDFTGKDRSTDPVSVTAEASKADGVAKEFTGKDRQTNEVRIIANSAPARNAMEAFLSDYRNTTITVSVGANTGSAASAINSVANGSYTATIRVVADTSSFNASFNALPSSKSIVNAAAPPAAPAVMRAAVVAPLAAPARTAEANVNISVQGFVGDEDMLARKIQRVLQTRDRRSGAVRVV